MGPNLRAISYVNGRFAAGPAACISILDRGFLLGDALFETVRVLDGRALFLREHIRRLRSSASHVGIALPLKEKDFQQILSDLQRRNRMPNAGARIVVSRGQYNGSIAPAPNAKPTIVVFMWKFEGYPQQFYENGVDVVVAREPSFSPAVNGVRVKSVNYLNNILAYGQAAKKGAHEAIMLSNRGDLAEGSTSNLFFSNGKELRTPSEDCGILPGISRDTVLRLAAKCKIRVREGRFPVKDLGNAYEAFLTSSLRGIVPVRKVDGLVLQGGMPGPLTRILMNEYARMIGMRAEPKNRTDGNKRRRS